MTDMLSYQHEYHAGNHADVLKHTCLALILDYLCKKDKPFTVIDSHSSAGRFRLDDERLLKTGEADGGIVRLMAYAKAAATSSLPTALQRYIELEKPYFKRGLYAASPEIERLCMRAGDQLHLVEKHPTAIESLKANVTLPLLTNGGEQKSAVKADIRNEDSYKALNSLCPPLVKRGLVLIDPSYEDASDYTKVEDAIKNVHRKWNTAIIALWYPLILRRKNETAQLLSSLEDFAKLQANPVETCRCQMQVKSPDQTEKEQAAHLYGSGMFILNPPWKLKEEMEQVKNSLEKLLAN